MRLTFLCIEIHLIFSIFMVIYVNDKLTFTSRSILLHTVIIIRFPHNIVLILKHKYIYII